MIRFLEGVLVGVVVASMVLDVLDPPPITWSVDLDLPPDATDEQMYAALTDAVKRSLVP